MARQLTTAEGPLLTNEYNNNNNYLSDNADSNDEGEDVLTIPKYKKYAIKLQSSSKYKPTTQNQDDDGMETIGTQDDIKEIENDDDNELKEFITKYKLKKLEEIFLNEGITIEFLISLSDQQIDEISKELTSKSIQQNKFKFAVNELKKDKKNDDDDVDIIYDDDNNHNINNNKHNDLETNKNDKIAIDKKTEIIKPKHFGAMKAVTSWIYNGSDNIKHEIILKHYTKMDKNMKSKRIIIVDSKERYSKKSNDTNFIINDCCDNLEIIISYNNDKTVTFYDLFINEISFDHLMHGRAESFSL